MKRLFLNGGVPWSAQDNNALACALQSYRKETINVAFCGFSRTESELEATIDELENIFNRFSGDKKCSFETMTTENFTEVSMWADVIHMPGGDPAKLLVELKKHSDLNKLWDSKIISGSSAGADVLCASFVYLQKKSIGEGFGWVKATLIPHWGISFQGYTDEDWEEVRAKALKQRPDLPVLCIPEGEFVEFAVQ